MSGNDVSIAFNGVQKLTKIRIELPRSYSINKISASHDDYLGKCEMTILAPILIGTQKHY